MPRVATASSLVTLGKEQWAKAQVELHGALPLDRIKRFDAYVTRTSWWRALAVCVWTPVPVIIVTIAVELIPLEDPHTHNARQSPRYWLRCFLMVAVASVCYLEQFRQHIPSLQLSRRCYPAIAIVSALIPTYVVFLVADLVGFPFPFSANVASLPWATTVIGLSVFVAREQLRTNSQLRRDLRSHLVVCGCQVFMTAIYPVYNTLFQRVSPWGQTAVVLVLPLIKLLSMNCISRWIANTDEARSESVIFNVEVFHSLYVSFSMQNSAAVHTMIAIMAVDFVQAWLSFRDIAALLKTIEPLIAKLPTGERDLISATSRILEVCTNSLGVQRLSISSPSTSSAGTPSAQLALLGESISKVHPDTTHLAPHSTDSPSTTQPKHVGASSLVRQIQKLLFLTEFVALVEFTEVLIPCIFNLSMIAMYYLPNRQYYSFLRDLPLDRLQHQIGNVFLYASLELVSLVIMGIILWKKLRLSLLHQIAFVLQHRQASIQSKVIMWALTVLQNLVVHGGVDYSFRFAWIKLKSTGARG